MKNRELYKLLKKNKLNSNSGFTLIELLVGLMMSLFVIGALGFGLMTVLASSQSENSKVKARTENSRALDFVSDELRRAVNIETNAANAGTDFSATGKTVVLALDIPEITSSTNAGARGRIVYYLKSTGLGNWKGPQVLYRWGPPLGTSGNYTTGTWQEEALMDGINNTTVSSPCTTGTVTPATPTGFYACTFLQDSAKAYDPQPLNADGTKNVNYNPRNTAQLFLTGQTKTANGVTNDSQTNDTQVVARARDTLANKVDDNNSVTWNFKDLGGRYGCQSGVANSNWNMQTNFGTNTTNLNADTTPWVQDTNKQPQPITINTSLPLVITATPFGSSNCDSRGNTATSNLNTAINVSHAVNFGKPITFNGDCDSSGGADCSAYNNKPRVKGDLEEAVQFFKKGYSIPEYGGYDAAGDGLDTNNDGVIDPGDQPSLGRFLYDQGFAMIDPSNTTTGTLTQILNNPLTKFIIPTADQVTASTTLTASEKAAFKLLRDDQRIVAFEVGQLYSDKRNDGTSITSGKNPGFDLQDNIFVVTSDVFKKKFNPSTCFDADGC